MDSEQAKKLQAMSMASRISRHLDVEFQGNEPKRERVTDAGFDLYADRDFSLDPMSSLVVPTGTRAKAPEGYFYMITGRSSLNKMNIHCFTGVIDATYSGEIMVCLINLSQSRFSAEEGDRIAQAIFYPILHPKFKEVEEFSFNSGDRGPAGWGSTGK